jgi:hypothetical protein
VICVFNPLAPPAGLKPQMQPPAENRDGTLNATMYYQILEAIIATKSRKRGGFRNNFRGITCVWNALVNRGKIADVLSE